MPLLPLVRFFYLVRGWYLFYGQVACDDGRIRCTTTWHPGFFSIGVVRTLAAQRLASFKSDSYHDTD